MITAREAFDQHHEAVFRFVYRLTRRSDVAEDITQECFLAFLRVRDRFDESRGTVKTWLFAVARNLAMKEYRDHKAETVWDESRLVTVHAQSADIGVSSAVESAVAGLPPLQQEAVILFQYEGFTLEEIAQVAGVDTGTVKSRLHRARERLRRSLAPYKSVGELHGRKIE